MGYLLNISIFFVWLVFCFCGRFILFMIYGIIYFVFLDWIFFSFKFNFYINRIFFSFVLFLVTLRVLLFSTYYIEGEANLVYFILIFMVFVVRIFFLNFRRGVFSILFRWDILGVSRFFLVLFYNNWDSCSGAMNTVLTNRIGDFFIFLFFVGFVFRSLSFFRVVFRVRLTVLLVLVAGFTKRAQFPFRGWLPKAMRAPTPVRALVHRRTLVTAGLILIMGFRVLSLGVNMSFLVGFVGLVTMVFSRVCALLEQDMKKVVALRTLSQMGFSILTLGLGLYFVSLLHLVSHALFKSCLFIQVGIFIHSFFRQQDVRNYNRLGSLCYFVQLQIIVTLFCLCGLLFTRGSVTKDIILEFFFVNVWSFCFGIIFFLGVFLTFIYRYRLFIGLVCSFNFSLLNVHVSLIMGLFSRVLVLFSVVGLWWLRVNVLTVPVLFLYVDVYVPLFYVVGVLVLIYMIVKLVFMGVKYGFLVDYLAKYYCYFNFVGRYVDMFVGKVLIDFVNLGGCFGIVIVGMFKNLGISVVVLVLFFFFIVV